ncbi:TPA: hypothetical protein L7V47_004025 [Klebsiella pneumoniae]|nr:hypothetical protein [Klebsiella pneumoniae]
MKKNNSFIFSLPEDKRHAFDAMLRRNDYGGYQEALEWLRFYNVISSRSALCRYSMALRKRDGIAPCSAGGTLARLQVLDGKQRREHDLKWKDRIEAKLDRLLELLEKDKT